MTRTKDFRFGLFLVSCMCFRSGSASQSCTQNCLELCNQESSLRLPILIVNVVKIGVKFSNVFNRDQCVDEGRFKQFEDD